MNNPLVTIIIPTYNRTHLIGETLDSVLAQIYSNWECIVVDDGSTDTTEEVLKIYCKNDERFQYHHRPKSKPKGANSCRNYGFELSKGDYINWFDDDDIMTNEFLLKKIECVEGNIDMVICNGYITNNEKEHTKDFKFELTNNLFEDYLLWNFQIITNSILFRKSYLKNFKLFDTKILRGQETEFFSRVFYQLELHKVKIVEEKLFGYRQHDKTKSHSNALYNPNYIESICIVSEQNFIRAKNIDNKKIMISIIKNLMDYFFKSIHNKDFNNSKILLNFIFKKYKHIDILKSIRFLFLFKVLLLFKRSSYKCEKIVLNNI